jgi:hypothetical protein
VSAARSLDDRDASGGNIRWWCHQYPFRGL